LRRRTIGDEAPIHDVPDGRDVVGADVVVLEVISVFPDVDAEERIVPSVSGLS